VGTALTRPCSSVPGFDKRSTGAGATQRGSVTTKDQDPVSNVDCISSVPADVAGEVVGVSSPPDGDTAFGWGDEVVLATVPQAVSASNTATTQAFRTFTTA
jgi:hypothetical protein